MSNTPQWPRKVQTKPAVETKRDEVEKVQRNKASAKRRKRRNQNDLGLDALGRIPH
jgi:hypothetical protein